MPYEIMRLDCFVEWVWRLRDDLAKARIARRLERLEKGNFGDCKPVGHGVWALRIDSGPGYRIYYCLKGQAVVILLCGGDKSSQQADILKAQNLASKLPKT